MLVQVVYLEVRQDALEQFIEEALANVKESKKEAGVIQFDLLQRQDAPASLMLYEVYESEAALEAHRHTPHFQRWTKAGVPLLAKARKRVMYSLVA